MAEKGIVFLWFDHAAEEAARFYVEHFPDAALGPINRSPVDWPDGSAGDVITVEFTVMGIPFVALNGGSYFKPNEATSIQLVTEDQAETDRLWDAITGNGGSESQCGWCKDRWGFSWQITPRQLLDAVADSDRAAAKRAMEAMFGMTKIDIAAIEAARAG